MGWICSILSIWPWSLERGLIEGGSMRHSGQLSWESRLKRDLVGPKECSRDAGNNSNRILEVGHSRGWHWALKKSMGAGLMDYRWGRREVLLGAGWQRVHQQMDTWVVSCVQWLFFFLIKKKPWCYHATMFLLVLTHALFKCYLGISNKWNIQTKNKSGNCNCTWLCRGHTFPSSRV